MHMPIEKTFRKLKFIVYPQLTNARINHRSLKHFVNFQSLSDPNNYHEFCRLLARLKSNYQLGELVKVENYPEVIRLIANFTVTSLQVSGHYLLQ